MAVNKLETEIIESILMNFPYLNKGYSLRNRYIIQKKLGQGGFGITYLAFDCNLDIDVCIKELFISGYSTRSPNMSVQSQTNGEFSFTDFIQRFIMEARQLARFKHVNIVRVLDVFEENNTAYMAMDFVHGETLKQRIQREGILSEENAITLLLQVMAATEEVHNKGMLHRDIKPENILITPEEVITLIDFGSAREFAEGKTITQSTMLTPGYAPPEQYSNRAKRGTYTDIYSIGATFYYMLTGEKPIAATDRHLEELKAPNKINPRVSEQLSSAVLLAMELKPENRFKNIANMRDAIITIQGLDQNNSNETRLEEEEKKILGNYSAVQRIESEMIAIDGGTFTMGCIKETDLLCRARERPAHEVSISSFKISKFQVTQDLWISVMGSNPSYNIGCINCPVEQVSWEDIQTFIRKLNEITGMNYRLPTEAEWEYAAIGGRYSNSYSFSGSNYLDDVSWQNRNSKGKTHPVGLKKPNELGLYDMSGNVWEWCNDWYDSYSNEHLKNPHGPSSGSYRVIRGGSWYDDMKNCRSKHRGYEYSGYRADKIGFRLAIS